MRKFSSQAAVFALVAVLGVVVAGCGQVGILKAKLAFKDANAAYTALNYETAAAKYEETIQACSEAMDGECVNPDLTAAYFFLANSYDNLFRPSRRGEPANDAYLTKAIDNYKKAAELEQDPRIKQLAMEYLVASYGPDKLNDPSQAEPVVRRMIDLDPNEPRNYFYLSRIYEDSGEYEEAERLLLKAREVRPTSPDVYMTLAGFYNRQGDFDMTMEALHARAQQEPNNPEAYQTIAVYYWEKAYRDFTTPEADKIRFVEAGLKASDRAIELKPDYVDALSYKNLLLRVQANLEKNPQRQQELMREAEQYYDQAEEIRSRQRLGAGE